MVENTLLTALLMTTLAGLSTGLGGLLVLWRRPDEGAVSLALGFAGGVMLAVSLADLVPAGLAYYGTVFGSGFAAGCAAASLLLCGMAVAGLLGRCLPDENEGLALLLGGSGTEGAASSAETLKNGAPAALPGAVAGQPADGLRLRTRALHCGLAVGMALLLHNLPEGILTLFSGVADPRAGLRMSLAIALHNIPEGISVAAPLWYATRSRVKSAGAAFASGLAEPAGALLAWCLLRGLLTEGFLNGLTLLVAGVMCWVSAAELLFSGFAMDQKLPTAAGFALGVCTMTLGIAALA